MLYESRRFWALGLAAVLGAGACVPKSTTTAAQTETPVQTQERTGPVTEMDRSLAKHFAPHFGFGVAMEPHYLDELGPIIHSSFNRLTAENVMKFARIHPSPDVYKFGPADQLAEFARSHDMRMTGHALVWYRETPHWLVEGDDPEAVKSRLKEHVDTVVDRYADVTDNWDVVNEIISDSPGKIYRDASEGSKLYGVLGKELVPLAFRYAESAVKKSGKDIALYYNDYNMVKADKRKKAIEMAKQIRDAGIRIDGIGAQAHWNMSWPSIQEVQAMIDDIVAAGFRVKISELDVSIYTKDDFDNERWQPEQPFTQELAQAQAERYKQLMQVFVDNSEHIDNVTIWGLSDDRTWLDNWPASGRNNHPLLFNDQDQPKPAYFALFEVNTGAGPQGGVQEAQ